MYTSIRTEQLWKTTEAWLDQTRSYEDFKTEVLKLYPGALGSRSHTLQELEWTVGRYARNGIQSTAELGEYYRQYLLISRYLIAQGSISNIEQSRGFFRGLQPALEVRIRKRLQQKFIDHFPDDPYPLSDIFEAADFILRGAASAPLALPQPLPIPSISQADSDEIAAKIGTLIAGLTEKLEQTLEDQIASAMAPRGAPDSPLCDRIEDWHQQNPGNTAAQLFCRKAANSPSEATTTQRIPALHQQQPQRHPVAPHHIHPCSSVETATSTTECEYEEPTVLAMLSKVLSDQFELETLAITTRSLRLPQIADEYAATARTLSQPKLHPSALTHTSRENNPQSPKRPADEPEVATQSAATEASCKGAPEIAPPPIHSLTHTAAEPSERSQPAILPPVAAEATQLFAIAAKATLSVVAAEATTSFVAAEATQSLSIAAEATLSVVATKATSSFVAAEATPSLFVAAEATPSLFVAAEASPSPSTAAQQQSALSSFPFLSERIPFAPFSSLLTTYHRCIPDMDFPRRSPQLPQCRPPSEPPPTNKTAHPVATRVTPAESRALIPFSSPNTRARTNLMQGTAFFFSWEENRGTAQPSKCRITTLTTSPSEHHPYTTNSPFRALPTVPHLCAALATQPRDIPYTDRAPY